MGVGREYARGFDALRRALADYLLEPALVPISISGPARHNAPTPWWLASESILANASTVPGARRRHAAGGPGDHGDQHPVHDHKNDHGDADLAASSVEDEAVASRLIALVELARNGDKE